MSKDDVKCPYCGADNEICHDDGYGLEEGVKHQQECRECERTFVYDTTICLYYEAYPAPCIDSGKHKWEETRTIPRCMRKLECSVCGETKEIDGIEIERKQYFEEMELKRKKLVEYHKKEQRRIKKIINDANKAKGI